MELHGLSSREDLINGLTNTSNWEHLLTKGLKQKGATATGAPTIDQYVESWNANYPNDLLYTAQNSTGYYVGTSENPTATAAFVSGYPGYNNTLYFPHTYSQEKDAWNGIQGYWLASPSASSDKMHVMFVHFTGMTADYPYSITGFAGRPLISLPSNVLGEKDTTSGKWIIE